MSLPQKTLAASSIHLIMVWWIGLVAAFFSAPARTADSLAAPTGAACTTQTAPELLDAVQRSSPPIQQVQIASRLQWIPLGRVAELLAVVPWNENTKFRIVVAPPQGEYPPPAVIDSDWIWAEPATKGPSGTDFLQDQSPLPKTSLRFTPLWRSPLAYWQPARVYVVGCLDGSAPVLYGRFDTTFTDPFACLVLTVFLCSVLYLLAASLTYKMHKDQRRIKDRPNDLLPGTNYAAFSAHLDPVVMTADDNGLGSPAKLQVLFFTLVVFGVLSYLWMATHHLSELSKSVLALMGISGAGAALSKATDVARMRLAFDNWAWLVARKWLPDGGPAETNRAKWRDVITEGGEFNVYRFQMLTFSALVGSALVVSATRLAYFTIPDTLLIVLASSQAIYLGGKVAASPSVDDLNAQIHRLQAKEGELLSAIYQRAPANGASEGRGLPLTHSELLERVGKCWPEYEDLWNQTQKIFVSALVREVTVVAPRHRPPFSHVLHPSQAFPLLEERFAAAILVYELLQARLAEDVTKFGQLGELRHLVQAFEKEYQEYEKAKYDTTKALDRYREAEIGEDAEEQLLRGEPKIEQQKVNQEASAYATVRDQLDSLHHRIKRINQLNDKLAKIIKEQQAKA